MPPLRYFVPNGFTAASLLLGLASVAMSAEGSFELAAWMILWGSLLDKADGTAARLMNATSRFGVEFDSFADFVAFGIAPAALVYFRLATVAVGPHKHLVMVAAGIYALALAIRLARFNTADENPSIFFGVPGTLMGTFVASLYLTWDKYALGESWLRVAPFLLLVAAAMMVSNLRLPKLKARRSKAANLVQGFNVALAYVFGPLMMFPEYLFALAATYLTVGLLVGARPQKLEEALEEEESQEQVAT
ncbi:MAG: CDP-alcohol phosphatidyltransferase family protein [Myxococcales bacterium]|nr:CDP-alcohol phosphatidyltransferase family protein [Myxococcales bacterium]